MKFGDFVSAVVLTLVALLMTVWRGAYESAYAFSPVLVAFLKFLLLATFGEMLVSRILVGHYLRKGFGLVPKAIVWGVLGVGVYAAFVVFESGTTTLFFGSFVPDGVGGRVLRAVLISVCMNAVFAPVLMTVHHLSDLFIDRHGGRFPLHDLNMGEILQSLDWNRMWSFVFARTIPLFWIPAHTVTFLIPASVRLLYAAGLSVVLGLFMALVRKPVRSRVSAEEGPK